MGNSGVAERRGGRALLPTATPCGGVSSAFCVVPCTWSRPVIVTTTEGKTRAVSNKQPLECVALECVPRRRRRTTSSSCELLRTARAAAAGQRCSSLTASAVLVARCFLSFSRLFHRHGQPSSLLPPLSFLPREPTAAVLPAFRPPLAAAAGEGARRVGGVNLLALLLLALHAAELSTLGDDGGLGVGVGEIHRDEDLVGGSATAA